MNFRSIAVAIALLIAPASSLAGTKLINMPAVGGTVIGGGSFTGVVSTSIANPGTTGAFSYTGAMTNSANYAFVAAGQPVVHSSGSLLAGFVASPDMSVGLHTNGTLAAFSAFPSGLHVNSSAMTNIAFHVNNSTNLDYVLWSPTFNIDATGAFSGSSSTTSALSGGMSASFFGTSANSPGPNGKFYSSGAITNSATAIFTYIGTPAAHTNSSANLFALSFVPNLSTTGHTSGSLAAVHMDGSYAGAGLYNSLHVNGSALVTNIILSQQGGMDYIINTPDYVVTGDGVTTYKDTPSEITTTTLNAAVIVDPTMSAAHSNGTYAGISIFPTTIHDNSSSVTMTAIHVDNSINLDYLLWSPQFKISPNGTITGSTTVSGSLTSQGIITSTQGTGGFNASGSLSDADRNFYTATGIPTAHSTATTIAGYTFNPTLSNGHSNGTVAAFNAFPSGAHVNSSAMTNVAFHVNNSTNLDYVLWSPAWNLTPGGAITSTNWSIATSGAIVSPQYGSNKINPTPTGTFLTSAAIGDQSNSVFSVNGTIAAHTNNSCNLFGFDFTPNLSASHTNASIAALHMDGSYVGAGVYAPLHVNGSALVTNIILAQNNSNLDYIINTPSYVVTGAGATSGTSATFTGNVSGSSRIISSYNGSVGSAFPIFHSNGSLSDTEVAVFGYNGQPVAHTTGSLISIFSANPDMSANHTNGTLAAFSAFPSGLHVNSSAMNNIALHINNSAYVDYLIWSPAWSLAPTGAISGSLSGISSISTGTLSASSTISATRTVSVPAGIVATSGAWTDGSGAGFAVANTPAAHTNNSCNIFGFSMQTNLSAAHTNGSVAALHMDGSYVGAGVFAPIHTNGSALVTSIILAQNATNLDYVINTPNFVVTGAGAVTVGAYDRHVQIPVNSSAFSGGGTCSYPGATPVAGGALMNQNTDLLYLQWEAPTDWDGTTAVQFEVDYIVSGVALTAGQTIKWNATYRTVAEGEDVDLAHSATAGTATVTYTDAGAGTAQGTVIHSKFTLSDANQPIAKGDHVYIQVIRDATTDTYAGDTCATAFEVIYKSVGIPMSN